MTINDQEIEEVDPVRCLFGAACILALGAVGVIFILLGLTL
jgi:hypothetical protein